MKKLISDLIRQVRGPAQIIFTIDGREYLKIIEGKPVKVTPGKDDIIIQIEHLTDLNV
jgi:hypothetical protein